MPVASSVPRSPRTPPNLAVLGLAVTLAGVMGFGCASQPVPVQAPQIQENPTRYLRHCLRGRPDGYYLKTYRSSYLADTPMFKPGTKLQLVQYTDKSLEFTIEGAACRMYYRDVPFPTTPDGVQQVIEKHFAETREELALDSMDPEVRKQVDGGNVAIGMTKQQVFTALGYPSHIGSYLSAEALPRDRIFDNPVWIYRYSEIPLYTTYWTYRFDDQGKLAQVQQ